ncbi:malate:quinone oxidoreductase [Taibaiella sp. KBW10]|nr:malate:quinone oxidoreductase [Taibaiella sp. KBW10]
MSHSGSDASYDIVLIGAGIMSATLGAMLKILQPNASIAIYERLGAIAAESSDAWNNAGTGHAALCELNYTPERPDGSVETVKAFGINEQFELSKQFWAYLLEKGKIKGPEAFLAQTPHMSFVIGEKNIAYLKQRYELLKPHHAFAAMEYSEDKEVIRKWAPLIMEGRAADEKVAATRVATGTDVNFGALSTFLFEAIGKEENVAFHYHHEVKNLSRNADQSWSVKVADLDQGKTFKVNAKFVFVGAGGRALSLIQKSGIPEGKGFGGFPVSGQWLRCVNPDIIAQHKAKVYGKAAVGAPPMSVPHLDTRVINGKKELLFGPYAGFSTKFLKQGSYWDLPCSIKGNNIYPMVRAGLANVSLTKYLIEQVMQKPKDRLEALREYFPNAKAEDWALEVAGQRVQVIKKDKEKGGVLQFGTEVITAADGSISGLLGASPGASTAVPIMIKLIERCFPKEMKENGWAIRMKELIPSYGQSLEKDAALYATIVKRSNDLLHIKEEI